MRRDRDHGDLPAGGTIARKHPTGAWRAILSIRLEHLFTRVERVLERAMPVRPQAGLAGVVDEQ